MLDVCYWHELQIVRIGSIPQDDRMLFREYLGGKPMPYITGDPQPFGWAWLDDYIAFLRTKGTIC